MTERLFRFYPFVNVESRDSKQPGAPAPLPEGKSTMLSAWFRSRAAISVWLTLTTLLLLAFVIAAGSAAAIQPGTARFQRTWERTDQPVLDGIVARTWMWGPQANTDVLQEPYGDAPGGTRQVQYFDKARMEDNSYRADGAPWDVTNGLLVVELITGNLQTGDAIFEQRQPAQVNVAGDADDPAGPTYATFGTVLDASPLPIGAPNAPFAIAQSIDRNGAVTEDLHWANYGVGTAHLDEVTNHTIAQPFWDFMNSSGTVYEDGQFVDSLLFADPYFATGRPITEAYWASVKVSDQQRDVLMQCFERRCLTYTPGNPEGFVVEAGNVGQHYYTWRYGNESPPSTSTPSPSPTPQPTAEPSPTASATLEPTPALNYAYADQWGGEVDAGTVFAEPGHVAIAPSGDIYITEQGTDRVQKYTHDGIFVLQWGELGAGDGQFDNPSGIAIDAAGTVYVVDTNNNRVQKFDANGNYLAQWGTHGANAAEFESPQGIAISSSNLVFVADTGNDRVQVFDTDGTYERQFGSFGTGDGQFNLAAEIAIDPASGNLYVADAFNNRIQKFDSNGAFLSKWGTKGAEESQFDTPQGVVVDSVGNVYVSDFRNNRIQKFSSDGAFLSLWKAIGVIIPFDGPLGLAVDSGDNVFVAEFKGNNVQKFDSDGNFLDFWYDGRRGWIPDASFGLALDADGNTYVADQYYQRVEKFDASGHWIDDIGQGLAVQSVIDPLAVVTSPDGYLYVAMNIGNISKFTQAGELVNQWGSDGTGNGQFDVPSGLAIDSDGNVYVTDLNNNRVQKFTSDGVYITQWGSPGNGDGEFNHPFDIAVYGDRVYVVDQSNFRVQVFDRDGSYLDQWGSVGSGAAQFQRPSGIAVDADGYVYVTDLGPDGMTANPAARVQKFAPNGDFLTQFGSFGSGDGELNMPYRVEVDAGGNVYVLDTGNHRVQKFMPVP